MRIIQKFGIQIVPFSAVSRISRNSNSNRVILNTIAIPKEVIHLERTHCSRINCTLSLHLYALMYVNYVNSHVVPPRIKCIVKAL